MRGFAKGILVLVAMILGVRCEVARASVIGGMSVGTTQSGGGAFVLASGTNSSVPNSFIDPTNPPPAIDHSIPTTANWVNLTATVTNLGQQMSAVFSELSGGGTPTDYYFTVTMKNNTVAPIQPVTFALNNGATFSYLVAPTSSYQPWSDPNGLTSTSLTFGGLSGGGGELMPGQTAILSFLVTTPGAVNPSGFTLTMTPNPEPSSLALAGVACVGGLIAKRRRNRKLAIESATTVA